VELYLYSPYMPSRCLMGQLYLLPLPFTTARCMDNVFFVQDQRVGFDAGYADSCTTQPPIQWVPDLSRG